jgi:PAS domain S-box-containing protein
MLEFSDKSRNELIQEILRLREQAESVPVSFPGIRVINKYEKSLSRIEEKYQILFSKAGEAIILFHRGQVVEANEKACIMLQWPLDKLLGKSISEISLAEQHQGRLSAKLWEDLMLRVLSGQTIKTNWFFSSQQNQEIETEITLSPIDLGPDRHVYVIARDISEKIRLRETLRLISEEQMLTKSGTWSIDVESGKTIWSDSLYVLHGISIGDQPPSLRDYLEKFVHPEDRKILSERVKAAVSTGERFEIDLRVILPGDFLRFFYLSCKIQLDHRQKPRFILGTCLDVTDRKKLEIQLTESKEGYKKLVEHLPEGVIIYQPDRILYANQGAFEISGVPENENIQVKTRSVFDFILPQYHAEVRKKILYIYRGKNVGPVEMKLVKDGPARETIDIEVRSVLVNYKGELCVQAIFSDISYRKKVEKSLRERERQLSTLISNLPGMAFRCLNDEKWTMEFVSEGSLMITGYEPEQIIGNSQVSYGNLIHEEDRQYVWDTVQIALKAHRSYVLNYRIIDRQNQVKWIYEQGKGVYTESGRLMAIEGFITDVSRQKQAEQELMVSRENYKNLVDFLPDGIIIHRYGKILFINPGIQRIFKLESLENVIGRNVLDFVPQEFHDTIKERIESANLGFEQSPAEIKVIDSLGNHVDVETRSRPFFFRGEPAILVFVHDLTSEKQLLREKYRAQIAEDTNRQLKEEINKRRRVQTELEQSRAYVTNILNSSIDMIIANDQHGNITEFNKTAQKNFGYGPEEARKMRVTELYANPEDQKKVVDSITKTGVFSGEIFNVDKNGRKFLSYLTATGLFDEAGNLIGGMGVSRDVTQIKEDQERLRSSEEQYKALFNQALIGITRISLDGYFLKANEHFSKITGYSQEELATMNRRQILHHDDIDFLDQQFFDLIHGKLAQAEFQKRIIRKDGSMVDVISNLTVVKNSAGEPDYLVGVYEDITERLKAQKALFDQKAKLNAILESSTHLVFSVDRDFRLVSFNHNTAKLFESVYGVAAHVGLKMDSEEVFSTHERNLLWTQNFSDAFNGKLSVFESDFVDKNGTQTHWEIFLSPVYNNDGLVSEVAGVGHDLTEKKKAENQARNQAAKLNAIFQSSSQQIYTVNSNMELTSFNDVYYRTALLDYGRKPYLGMNVKKAVLEIFSPEEASYYLEAQDRAFAGSPQQYEYKRIGQNGALSYYQVYVDPIVLGNKSIEEVSYIVHDITERKIAQKRIVDSLKEKEILLKEVHHRVKNNLQVISSILNLQKSYLKDDKMAEILVEIQNRIKSMSFVHENLYQANDFSTIDFNGYVSDLLSHISQTYHQDQISIIVDLHDSNIPLNLDQAIPCGLIITELVSNSFKYAFPDKKKGQIKVTVREKNQQVELSVQDNGIGFQKEFNFEESQTLGLQLVTSLVEQLDGSIQKSKRKGVGFVVKFNIK